MAIAEPGSTFELDQSVWELGTSVTVHRRYFAASGQNCLSISVALPAGEESAVVCEYKQGLWGVSRAITEPQVNR